MARQTFSSGQILTASQVNTLQASVWSDDVNTQTGTSYTLLLTDAGKQVTMSNVGASTLEIPPNSSVAFAIGVRIQVVQLGAGVVTLTAGAGVTVIKPAVPLAMTQYQVATLVKTASDTWTVAFSAGGTLSSLTVTGAVTAGSLAGNLTGNVSGNVTGNVTGNVSGSSGSCTGNAATATNVAYSGLTGAVPTWNQNTTGNAATASSVPRTGITNVKFGVETPTLNASNQGTFNHGLGTTPAGLVMTNGNLAANSGYPSVISVSSTQVNFEATGAVPSIAFQVNYIAWA